MRSNRGITRPRIPKCQLFSFTPPSASAKVASGNSAARGSLNSAATCSFDGQNNNRIKKRLVRLPKLCSSPDQIFSHFQFIEHFQMNSFIREGMGQHHFHKNRKTAISDLNNTLTLY